MRDSQRKALELSEVREQLNTNPTPRTRPTFGSARFPLKRSGGDAVRAEEKADAEAEAEERAGANGDGETAELRTLVAEVRCAAYLEAAASGSALEGREAELNQHLGLASNQVPWQALEVRADATTTPPADANIPQPNDLGACVRAFG